MNNFQYHVTEWARDCFGSEITDHKEERNHRFLEEALEAAQAFGCTKEDALKLVDYVFSRPVGEPRNEVGGTMLTLAALCEAHDINMMACGKFELDRVSQPAVMEKIRLKNASKPRSGPLPGVAT